VPGLIRNEIFKYHQLNLRAIKVIKNPLQLQLKIYPFPVKQSSGKTDHGVEIGPMPALCFQVYGSFKILLIFKTD
jgi:hypothetical protein